MKIVDEVRREIQRRNIALGALFGFVSWVFAASLCESVNFLTLLGGLIIGVLVGVLAGFLSVTKSQIKSGLMDRQATLEPLIRDYPQEIEEEMRQYEAAVEEARLELEELPLQQAECLATYQREFAEVQLALTSFK